MLYKGILMQYYNTMVYRLKPLWKCPKCGERFVGKNMPHSCGKFSLNDLFAKSDPQVMKKFGKFAKIVRACGPVRIIPQKTRVVFMARVRFAGAMPRKKYLLCSLGMPRRFESQRFLKIESYMANFHGHTFRVDTLDDLDNEVQGWLYEAYKLGKQKPLLARGGVAT
jgi:hypothetical protein